MSAWPQRRPRMMVLAGVAALGIALAGCSGSNSPHQSTGSGRRPDRSDQPSTDGTFHDAGGGAAGHLDLERQVRGDGRGRRHAGHA